VRCGGILCAFLSTNVWRVSALIERKGPREGKRRTLRVAREGKGIKRGKEGRGRTSASGEFDAGRSSNPMIAS